MQLNALQHIKRKREKRKRKRKVPGRRCRDGVSIILYIAKYATEEERDRRSGTITDGMALMQDYTERSACG